MRTPHWWGPEGPDASLLGHLSMRADAEACVITGEHRVPVARWPCRFGRPRSPAWRVPGFGNVARAVFVAAGTRRAVWPKRGRKARHVRHRRRIATYVWVPRLARRTARLEHRERRPTDSHLRVARGG